jgi:hypothetical protein
LLFAGDHMLRADWFTEDLAAARGASISKIGLARAQ